MCSEALQEVLFPFQQLVTARKRRLRRLCFYTCLSVHRAGGGGIPACTEADPSQKTATAAGGTHPTGMHSGHLVVLGA